MLIAVHDEKCYAAHFGVWAVDPAWLRQAVQSVRSGAIKAAERVEVKGAGAYTQQDNVAIVRINGPMMKGLSKYADNTSTIAVRRQLRDAVSNKDVGGILLAIDSPGGTVAGTMELANAVRDAGKEKPLHAFIEDTGASAAYWTASQAQRVSANEAAMVGSIGTYSILYDTSAMAEAEGVKPVVFTTGPYKAMGEPGVAITDEQREYWQGIVNELETLFERAVAKGRNMPAKEVRELADGRVHLAKAAQGLGLIDAVETFEIAFRKLQSEIKSAGTPRRNNAERRMRL
jgi:signal peptide peptidase SppA